MYNGMNYNSTQRKERTVSCNAIGDGSVKAAKRCMKYRVKIFFFEIIIECRIFFVKNNNYIKKNYAQKQYIDYKIIKFNIIRKL